jgi:hypothetical protein
MCIPAGWSFAHKFFNPDPSQFNTIRCSNQTLSAADHKTLLLPIAAVLKVP